MTILTPIVIDLINPDPLPIVNAKQGDTGRGIRVTVTMDGQVCQFSSEEINIFIRKPDGKLIYNGCEVQSGDVVAMFTSQALAVPGKLQVELEILSGEEKISTPIAMVRVLPTNINAEAIESTNEFNRYETIITEMEASEAERSEAEAERIAAEEARAAAESERSEAEGDRAAAENERISAETEREETEALRAQTEALRMQAEEARVAAEELREAAKLAMQQATEAANAAAEAAGDYVLGDISEKTITFTEATERVNLESGESMATLFGKIKKWFSDLQDTAFASIANNLYPIGSIYINTTNTNPGTLFGGTWIAWGSGRMPVGVDASDPNFNAAEKAGGSVSHTHASPQHTHGINAHSHTMAHTHTINSHTHAGPLHSHSFDGYAKLDISGGNIMLERTANQSAWVARNIQANGGLTHSTPGISSNHSNTIVVGTIGNAGNGSTGGSGVLTSNSSSAANTGGVALATNNNAAANTGSASSLPPYITCYMWKRIA